jgi:hypothetical protein
LANSTKNNKQGTKNEGFQIQHLGQNSNQNLFLHQMHFPESHSHAIKNTFFLSDALHDAHGPEAVGASFLIFLFFIFL